MPFQSEKQRRYMHANLPEIANRWERDYAGGGLARLPQALTTDDTVGEQIKEMMNTKTAFRPNTLLDNRIKTMQSMEDEGYSQPNLPNLKQKDWNQHIDEKTPLSLPKKQYENVEGFTSLTNDEYLDQNDLYASANNTMIDGTYVDDTDSGIAGLSTDVFEPSAYETFDKDPNYLKNLYESGEETIGNIWQGGKDKASWLKDAAMTGIGKAINFPIGLLTKAVSNPLNPGSKNYNPYLGGQIDYLGGALGTQSSPYQFRSGKGSSVLAGKNLVSGFGTNDYNKMLQKRIDYFENFKKKRALTIAQNKKLQDTIAEKKRADELAAKQQATLRQQVRQQAAANKAAGTGGYQSSFGKDEGFMGGSGTSDDMGSFAQGGLAGLWHRK